MSFALPWHRTVLVLALAGSMLASPCLAGNASTLHAPFLVAPMNGYAWQVASGDLNRDGVRDLVVSNGFSDANFINQVSVLLGRGDGRFDVATDLYIGRVDAVTVGDVNGDGLPDAIAAGDQLQILLGDGAGGLHNAGLSYAVSGPIAVADLNADGKLDVVGMNVNGGAVSVLMGNGNGSFQAPLALASAMPSFIAIGDLDADGIPDIVTSPRDSSRLIVFLGRANGQFATRATYATSNPAFAASLADWNGDHAPDLVIANRSHTTVSVLMGNGAGGFGAGADVETGNSVAAGSCAAGDFDGDGRLDVAVADDHSATVAILLGNGAGGFPSRQRATTSLYASYLIADDMNGDGRPDLAVTTSRHGVAIMLATADGMFGYPVNAIGSGSMVEGSVVADFNGDGRPDLPMAQTTSATVSLLLGDGAGGFPTSNVFPLPAAPRAMAVGDLNTDGNADVVVAASRTVSALLADGAGHLGNRVDVSLGVSLGSGSSGDPIAIGDVNGDGWPDIALASAGLVSPFPAYVSILLGDGTGHFGPRTDIPVGTSTGSGSIAVGAMDGDANLDVVVTSGAAKVSILFGNGDGSFSRLKTFAIPYGTPENLAVADLDHDGRLDVALSCGSVVDVLYGNGGGDTLASRAYPVALGAHGLAAADLDGDGNLDLATLSGALPGSLTLLTGDGTRGFADRVDFGLGLASLSTLVVGDVNGDHNLEAITDGMRVLLNATPDRPMPPSPAPRQRGDYANYVTMESAASTTAHPTVSIGPNPSTGTCTIVFTLPRAGRVWIEVLDLAGRRIAVLADGLYEGRHEIVWNAAAGTHPSGVYLVRYRIDERSFVERLMVLR